MFKICFVGLGSISRRHIRNLSEVLSEKKESFLVDVLRHKIADIPTELNEFIKNQFFNVFDLPNDYDIIFITNPTMMHYQTIINLQSKTKHMFIEKPIFDCVSYDISKIDDSKGTYYVACPLRYTEVIRYLKEYLEEQKVNAVRAICSSYLPEWREGVDYRNSYSAQKILGGGVAKDLIHEWDYLVYLFGMPIEVKSLTNKCSNLEIDTEDLAVYIAKYEDVILSLHLDYFGRIPKREVEIYMNDDIIVGDILEGTVKFLKSGEKITFSQSRNDYQKAELKAFLSMVNGDLDNTNSIRVALDILKIAES